MTDAQMTDRWARRVLLFFALVGLLHVPAFYALVYVEAMRQSPPVLEACPTPKPVRPAEIKP